MLKIQLYSFFIAFFDQINAAWLSIGDFQKHKHITDPKPERQFTMLIYAPLLSNECFKL